MGQSRLNGLAQMSINRDLPIDAEDLLNELAKKKRRLNFLLRLASVTIYVRVSLYQLLCVLC